MYIVLVVWAQSSFRQYHIFKHFDATQLLSSLLCTVTFITGVTLWIGNELHTISFFQEPARSDINLTDTEQYWMQCDSYQLYNKLSG